MEGNYTSNKGHLHSYPNQPSKIKDIMYLTRLIARFDISASINMFDCIVLNFKHAYSIQAAELPIIPIRNYDIHRNRNRY